MATPAVSDRISESSDCIESVTLVWATPLTLLRRWESSSFGWGQYRWARARHYSRAYSSRTSRS